MIDREEIAVSEHIEVVIEDDGPGFPDTQLLSLGQRGLRLDEQSQGYGLGLAIAIAIARDIVEAYEGAMAFSRSSLGGLAVRVRLPAG